MARPRSPLRDKAFEIYKERNGNIDLVEIARQLGSAPGTVRGWKNKDKWDDRLNGTLQKDTERSKPKTKERSSKARPKAKDKLPEEYITEKDIEGANLTEMQRLFCLYFVKLKNATQAAINAGYSPATAYSIGHENLKKPDIRAEINRLRTRLSNELFIDAMDVLEQYAKIAFSDITNYVEFGQEEVPVMTKSGPLTREDPETGEEVIVTKMINTVRFKESYSVDGQLISEVRQGKDGASIKLVEKMKALEKLEKYFDVIPDKWKRQLEEEKVKIAKMRVPNNAITNNIEITVELVGDAE